MENESDGCLCFIKKEKGCQFPGMAGNEERTRWLPFFLPR